MWFSEFIRDQKLFGVDVIHFNNDHIQRQRWFRGKKLIRAERLRQSRVLSQLILKTNKASLFYSLFMECENLDHVV